MSDQCFCLQIYIYLSYSHRFVHNVVSVAVIVGVYVHMVVGEKKKGEREFPLGANRRYMYTFETASPHKFACICRHQQRFIDFRSTRTRTQSRTKRRALVFHPVCISPLLSSVFLFPFLKPAETTRARRRVINKKQKQMLVHPCNCAAFPSFKTANYLFFDSVSSNISLLF